MAHTPNLGSDRRNDTRPSPARRARRNRVQVESRVGTQRIRPQAQAIDKFVQAPGGGPQQSPLSGLSSALASLSTQFTKSQAADERKLKTEAEAAAEREVARGDFEELDAMVRSGELPEFSSPFHRAAFFRIYGREVGERAAEQLQSDYANFDKDNGHFDEFITDSLDKALEGIDRDSQDGASIQAGLLSVFNRTADRLRGVQKDNEDANVLATKYQGIRGLLREADQDGGNNPEAIRLAIEEMRGSDSLRLLTIGKSEYDDLVLDFAAELAEKGREASVEAILKDTRGKIGSIAGKANAQGIRAKKILKLAKKVREVNEATLLQLTVAQHEINAGNGQLDIKAAVALALSNNKAMSDSKLESLIVKNAKAQNDGATLRIGMDLGAKGVLGPARSNFTKKMLTKIDNNFMSQIEAEGQKKGMSPEQIIGLQAKWLVQNDGTNNFWKDVLTTAAGQATTLNLADGNIPKTVSFGIDLYQQLYASDPGLLIRHIPDKRDREFYEGIRVQESGLRVERSQALLNMIRIQQEPDTPRAAAARQRLFDVLATAIDNALDDATSWQPEWALGGAPDIVNSSYVGKRLEELASVHVRLGLGVEKSLELAQVALLQSHTNINGFLVFTGGRKLDGADINEKFRTAAARFMAANPDQDYDLSDLSFIPISHGQDGVWEIIDLTGMTARGVPGSTTFTLRELNAAKIEKARTDVNTNLQISQDSKGQLEVIMDRAFGPNSPLGRQGIAAKRAHALRTATGRGAGDDKITVENLPNDDEGPSVTYTQAPLGIRNQNPINLRLNASSIKFNGVINGDTGEEFLIFESAKLGIRAAARQLLTLRKRDGIVTMGAIISTLSPPNENDTAGLIRSAELATGISSDMEVDVTDDAMMMRILKVLINQENGYQPYSEELIQSAITSAKRS